MPEEVKQHTAVVCDKVKVKDSIGCDKYSCQVTGFTSVGDINSHLLDFEWSLGTDQLEPSVAKYIHILVFIVRGQITPLEFPYAQYPQEE